MKILIINHEFPPTGGGAATATEIFAKSLAERKDDVEIITSQLTGFKKLEFIDGYRIRRILGARKLYHSGKLFEYIIFIIHGFFYFLINYKGEKSDIVYAFFTLPAGLLALFLKKIYGIPYFIFLRGIDVPGFYGGKFSFLNKVFKPLIKFIWSNSEKIIANSQSLKDLASKIFESKPIFVIPNVVDTNLFFPAKGVAESKEIKIIFVGRLNKQKGLNYLLESIVQLNRISGLKPFYLEIIGDGPEKKDLIQKTNILNISSKVKFSGWVERGCLATKYQNSDIFISSSLDEGMPNVILEAMACGLPIVATDIPAHRELIKQGINGLLVPIKDSQGLVNAIKVLIEERTLRHKFSEENVKRINEFSWQNIYKYLQKLKI